jgi:hypothetical protein
MRFYKKGESSPPDLQAGRKAVTDSGKKILRYKVFEPFLPLIAGLMAVLLHLPFIWVDFDLLHDGIVLSGVVGLIEGREMHRDIATYYGPGTAWSQAALIIILGLEPTLVSLRIWAVLNIGAIAFLTARLGSVLPSHVGLGPNSSFAISILWISSSSVLMTSHLMSWPTLLSALLVVLSLNFLGSAFVHSDEDRSLRATIFLVAAGFLLGLILFVRINVGVSVWLGLACVQLISLFSRNVKSVKLLSWLFLGGLLGASAVVIRLLSTHSLVAFAQQTASLTGWHAGVSSQWGFLGGILGKFGDVLFGLGGFLIAFVIVVLLAEKFQPLVWYRRSLHLVGVAVVGCAFALYFVATGSFSTIVNAFYRPTLTNSLQAIRDMITVESEVLYLILFLSLAAGVLLIAQSVRKIFTFETPSPLRELQLLLVVGLSLVGYVGVYPVYDVHHVWWGGSLGLVAVSVLLNRSNWYAGGFPLLWKRAIPAVLGFVSIAVSVFAIVGLLSTASNRSEKLFPQFEAIGNGVVLSEETIRELELVSPVYQVLSEENGTVDFFVADGGVSVLTGAYRDSDEYFYWDATFTSLRQGIIPDGRESPDWIVFDSEIPKISKERPVAEFAAVFGYKVLLCNERYCLLQRY